MEIKRYVELRDMKVATLHRKGPDTFEVVVVQRDPITLARKPPEIVGCNPAGMKAAIEAAEKKRAEALAEIDADIAGMKAVLADMEVLEATEKAREAAEDAAIMGTPAP